MRQVKESARSYVPLLIIAGKEYGSGSSRDWAAKGVLLLGVRAVIAERFEQSDGERGHELILAESSRMAPSI